jgi:Fe-S cluster assembly ATP-binding protein
MGVLLITHYHRILNYIKPQFVHVMTDGKIAMSGGEELAAQLEEKGYTWLKEAPAT